MARFAAKGKGDTIDDSLARHLDQLRTFPANGRATISIARAGILHSDLVRLVLDHELAAAWLAVAQLDQFLARLQANPLVAAIVADPQIPFTALEAVSLSTSST